LKSKVVVTDSQTAGENVYNFLHTSIMELRVKPGQMINVNELSEFLKVSRSPIRDALIQLGKDGLVTTTPQKGTMVSKIDVKRVKEERFIRACIEERVVEEFLGLYQESDITKMRAILKRQEQMISEENARQFLSLDDDFHAVFFEATDRPFCLKSVLNMSSHYYRIRLLSLSEPEIQQRTFAQHEEIMQLLLAKDMEKLKKLLDFHIIQKAGEESRMKRIYPDLFTDVVAPYSTSREIWENDFLQSVSD
jgi:GntR family transcriptional regulator, rspAB operon transcriptional repressor